MHDDITAKHHWTVNVDPLTGKKVKIRKSLLIEQRMQIYDTLFEKMEKLIQTYNPCERRIENGVMRCAKYKDISECCNGKKCKYLTNTGCSVKNLMCKLHICWANQANFKQKHPILYRRWLIWHGTMYALDLNRGWASREEVKRAVKMYME